mgnify:CR=1 FL=1
MSEEIIDEATNDARNLADRINPDDYTTLKLYWQKKSFASIAFMLRKYGIEFKGLTHLEVLVGELIKMKEQK